MTLLHLRNLYQPAEKIIFRRLLKKDQMQGPRKPEERGVLGGTLQRRRVRETTQMVVFQQPASYFLPL